MPRWKPNAAGRLHDAAIALFVEQGFDNTTVAEIAERAGLTERTFFNHFANKRDVLFGKPSELQEQIVAREIAASAADVAALDAVVHGLQATADEVLEELRGPATRRRQIIATTPELQEREESKLSSLTSVIARTLQKRGLDSDAALLTARVGVLIKQMAEQRWVQPGEQRRLRELLADALASIRAVTNQTPP
ncbi:TetR family transcriptional regulator [Bordetella genomosp. 10]|uniref:TetR family transcriptional regulator n=1 Tax=Bordetella genomosp. 10 TaxID=1416804 RepID=A0A261RYQ4_9BORD|nr:TetR/AcrR family transcriptional regulator [Bordetella genomosp. 10]OZI30001.1 TetR family transcriptional regulator [Bordetella genomosp. 10]